MAQKDGVEVAIEQSAGGLARYVRENPLAVIAGAVIFGMLLTRFAFLDRSEDEG